MNRRLEVENRICSLKNDIEHQIEQDGVKLRMTKWTHPEEHWDGTYTVRVRMVLEFEDMDEHK